MVRSPRFRPVGRNLEPRGQLVQFLKNEIDGYFPSEALGRENFAEFFLEQMSDHEYHAAEPGPDRVVDRVIDDRLAVRPHAVHLLERSVAGTHARRQYQKCRFFHHDFIRSPSERDLFRDRLPKRRRGTAIPAE